MMPKNVLGSQQQEFIKSPSSSPENANLRIKKLRSKNRRQIMDSIQSTEKPSALRQQTLGLSNGAMVGKPLLNSIPKLNISLEKKITNDPLLNETQDQEKPTIHSDDLHDDKLLESIPSSPPMTPYKRVAFSSDPPSMISSSPIKSPNKPKSILKQTSIKSYNTFTVDQMLQGNLSNIWPDGYVLHVPETYVNKAKVVRSCVTILKNPKCDKKYEIFATLNHLIKQSYNNLNNAFSLDSVYNLLKAIEIDLVDLTKEIENEISPFRLRISSQGIKLLASLHKLVTNNESVNISLKSVLTIMKSPNISKSLASSVIQLWKSKELKEFEHVESLIASCIQMKYFLSATVICERLNILSRIVIAKPAISSKCGYQILNYIFFTMLNTDVPAYSKIFSFCIHLLTQYAKNSECKSIVLKILHEPINDYLSSTIKSSVFEPPTKWSNISEALTRTLLYAIHIKLGKQVLEVWFLILFMCCYKRPQFSLATWELIDQWTEVYEKGLESNKDFESLYIEKWNIISYNFQINSLNNDDQFSIDKKVSLLIRPLKQVSNDQYKYLYYKIFYPIHWQLTHNNYNDIIRRELVTPLLNLITEAPQSWDIEPVLSRICTIDTPLLNMKQFNDPESVVWIQDSQAWKQVLSPISIQLYCDNFDLICEVIERAFETREFEKSCEILSNVIYQPLHYLKEQQDERYQKVIHKVFNLIIIILKGQKEHISQAQGEEEAKRFFKLIQDADIELLFMPNEISLLHKIANEFSNANNIDFINEFILLCLTKFNSDNIFGAFITSDIFKNLQLLRKACAERSFPPFLNYWVRLEKLEKNGNVDVIRSDPSLLSIRYKYFFSSYLKESINGEDFIKRVNIQGRAIMDYQICEYFETGFYLFVFDMILHGFIEFERQDRFYKVITLDIFQTIIWKSSLDWEKFINLILSLPSIELIPGEWSNFIMEEINHRLERGVLLKYEFQEILRVLKMNGGDQKLFIDFEKLCQKFKIESPFRQSLKGSIKETQVLHSSLHHHEMMMDLGNKRRQTRSMTKENSFEQETVLKLRKRPRSFEPSPVKKKKFINLSNSKEERKNHMLDLVKVSLERNNSDLGDGAETATKSEIDEFQIMLEKINNKRIDLGHGDKEVLTKQLLSVLMKLSE